MKRYVMKRAYNSLLSQISYAQNEERRVVEQIEQAVGFRSVEIKKGQLLVNEMCIRDRATKL